MTTLLRRRVFPNFSRTADQQIVNIGFIPRNCRQCQTRVRDDFLINEVLFVIIQGDHRCAKIMALPRVLLRFPKVASPFSTGFSRY
jgi:hypothetical protein